MSQCTSEQCRVVVISQALQRWATIKHPEMQKLEEQKQKEREEQEEMNAF